MHGWWLGKGALLVYIFTCIPLNRFSGILLVQNRIYPLEPALTTTSDDSVAVYTFDPMLCTWQIINSRYFVYCEYAPAQYSVLYINRMLCMTMLNMRTVQYVHVCMCTCRHV